MFSLLKWRFIWTVMSTHANPSFLPLSNDGCFCINSFVAFSSAEYSDFTRNSGNLSAECKLKKRPKRLDGTRMLGSVIPETRYRKPKNMTIIWVFISPTLLNSWPKIVRLFRYESLVAVATNWHSIQMIDIRVYFGCATVGVVSAVICLLLKLDQTVYDPFLQISFRHFQMRNDCSQLSRIIYAR